MRETSETAKVTLYYWLIALFGFLLSFVKLVLPGVSLSFPIWLALTFGLSSFGCIMMHLSNPGSTSKAIKGLHHQLLISITGGGIVGLLMYFSPWLAYFVFEFLYLCWLFLFIEIVYFGIKILFPRKGKTSGKNENLDCETAPPPQAPGQRAKLYYWLATVAGFLPIVGFFFQIIPTAVSGTWAVVAFGLSGFGCTMMHLANHRSANRAIKGFYRRLLIGIAGGCVVVLMVYLAPLFPGWLILQLYFLYPLFLFIEIVYFGIRLLFSTMSK